MGGKENTLPQSWPQHLYHSTFMLTNLHTLVFIHTHANKQVSQYTQTHIFAHTHIYETHKQVSQYTHAHTFAVIHKHTPINRCYSVHMPTHLHTHPYIHTHTNKPISQYTHVHTFACIHIHTHTILFFRNNFSGSVIFTLLQVFGPLLLEE